MKQLSFQSRRDFLQTLTKALGTSVFASTLSLTTLNVALAYQRQQFYKLEDGKLFSRAQLETLGHICQTIIPTTDTPGAGEIDCHGFIDHQLFAVHSKAHQMQALALIDTIDAVSITHLKKPFALLIKTQQTSCLINIETGKWANSDTVFQFKQLKYLNAFGYFTSEVGATQVLNYQPVPGGYTPSVPVTAQTTNHGALSFY